MGTVITSDLDWCGWMLPAHLSFSLHTDTHAHICKFSRTIRSNDTPHYFGRHILRTRLFTCVTAVALAC